MAITRALHADVRTADRREETRTSAFVELGFGAIYLLLLLVTPFMIAAMVAWSAVRSAVGPLTRARNRMRRTSG